ncbi:GyrI-like domain-containing protein [Paenibacillus sp. CAU 1782]
MQHIEIKQKPELKLVGLALRASLNEDIEQGLVKGLRKTLAPRRNEISAATGESIYLVQAYDDCEWTPDTPFLHFVGVEASDFAELPEGMSTHILPAGKFLEFKHQGPEEEIDDTYSAINEWLEINGYVEPRAFDYEQWHPVLLNHSNPPVIPIYIPVK